MTKIITFVQSGEIMADVFDVAKYILSKKGKLSTFKLQKLCYYSQAWSLVWDDAQLFENKIYAWANGPVCVDLYHEHKGMFNIDALEKGDISKLTDDEKETIDAVLRSYGSKSGQQLSNMTNEEAPWVNARAGLGVGERGNNEIKLDDMAEYYSGLYANQQATQS